ncbi:MAG: 2Fe-2S iron-sulfur cluster-binding protein [Pseudomonadota bacterium]
MPRIFFIRPDGETVEVDAKDGETVMEAGRDALVGIEGTCGGCISCATCHVILEPDWYEKVGAPDEDEEDMLDLALGREERSRLGCQITMSDDLDGLRCVVPEEF